ncbi:helix-turn-helix transcriptional regulator [Streptomyces sp. Adlamb9]|uniref:helix-turn-helix transcriptional regulator n=1 Tax=Streptomyces sp. Adlamb9 TaxID=3400629 RepID=UPI003F1CAE2A
MPNERPTARVLAMLELLQDRPGISGRDLAQRLGVGERTVRRYATHLTDLGIPVSAERGRYGGYRLPPTFRLPPLALTDKEAAAVVLGLLSSLPHGLPDGSAESALAKINRVLPKPVADQVAALRDTLAHTPPPDETAAPDPRIALDLATAARDRRRVRITYQSWRGETSARDLDPYGLVLHGGRWYVTGLDSRRAEIRVFRVDRVRSLQPAADPRATPPPPGYDPAAQLTAALGEVAGRHRVRVLLHTTLEQAARRIPPTAATLVRTAEGVLLETRAERFDTMAGYLAGLGCPLTVHHPAELREALARLSERLASSAASGGRDMGPVRER